MAQHRSNSSSRVSVMVSIECQAAKNTERLLNFLEFAEKYFFRFADKGLNTAQNVTIVKWRAKRFTRSARGAFKVVPSRKFHKVQGCVELFELTGCQESDLHNPPCIK